MVFEWAAISPRAEPKSISTGAPSLRMMMLSGAMSRCRKSCFVDQLQRVEQRSDDGVELFLARGAAEALQPGLEALSFLEMEDHVAGIIGAEVTVHAHDIGVIELGKCLGFLDEAVEPPAVVVLAVLRPWRGLDAAGASCEIRREVLLDRHMAVERHLVGEIGYAEAARAEHALDAVVPD